MSKPMKLLFFDIDGTIFDDQRNLPPSVLPAMEAARRNGHRLIINTGRTMCNTAHVLDGFPLDGWIIGCGTRILYEGETLLAMRRSPGETRRLREILLGMEMPAIWECDNAMYFDPLGPAHPALAGFRKWAEDHGIFREITAEDPDFRAVKMFCFADEAEKDRMEALTEAAGIPYTAINRGKGAWEVVPAGYSKGIGMDILREKLGVAKEDCFAFGDSRNDLTMFAHAGVSIAMGNAPEDVRRVCSYVTDRPERDGIEKAMRHFGLI